MAVVVVAGVGDKDGSPGTCLFEALSEATGGRGYRRDTTCGDTTSLVVGPVRADEWGPGAAEVTDVPRVTLSRYRDESEHDQLDIFELPWSDISRFPKGLPGFVATLFGLGVQFGTIGLEAITKPKHRRTTATSALMNAASWVAAALVVPLTATAVVAAVNLWLVLEAPAGMPAWLMSVIVGALGGLAVWFVAEAVAKGGWAYGKGLFHPFDPRLWALVAYAAGCGVWIWRDVVDPSVKLASADTLLYITGYGLRPVWLLAVTVVALALLALAATGLRHGRWLLPGRRGGEADSRGRWVSGVLASIFSPLVVAIVGTLLFAGLAGVTFKSADGARWRADAAKVTCFATPASWHVGTRCGKQPGTWGTDAATVVALNASARAANDAAANAKTSVEAVADTARAADFTKTADALESQAGMTPVDWAKALFVIIAIPVTDATIAVLLLLAGALLLFAAAAAFSRRRRGAALTVVLRTLGSGLLSMVLLVLTLLGIATTWGVWLGLPHALSFLTGNPWDLARGTWFSGAGAALAGLLLIGRFIPIDLTGWGGSVGKLKVGGAEVGGNLEVLRAHLDPAYDIATYLRLYRDKSGLRPQIIARFRALLREISRRNYDVLLIVAHSQGSVLAAATLFGDPYRRGAEDTSGHGVLAWNELEGRNPPRLPRSTALLTCGCPLRQSYGARLGEFDWLWSEDLEAGALEPLSVAWINAYRPRDYIGQAVFHRPLTRQTQQQGQSREATPAGEVRRIDHCLPGTGNHVGYWTDAEFALQVDAAIARCLDHEARLASETLVS